MHNSILMEFYYRVSFNHSDHKWPNHDRGYPIIKLRVYQHAVV